MNKAVFLDRDGVINHDDGHVGRIKDFKFLSGVFEAIQKLQSAGYLIIIVTNQAGIAKKYFSEEDYRKLTEYMLNKFRASGIEIKKIYYCPHHPEDNCDCRKPKIKFLKEASREFSIDLNSSWVIGDKLTDIEMGKNAGCKTILIDSKYVNNIKIEKVKDLLEASYIIIKCQ